MSGLRQDVVLAPEDGSLGPLLRLADDRLAPGTGYGRHAHRAVDVVAVVLEGEVRHRWRGDALLRAGDVAVLRAGTGLDHDEVAGDGGARLLQAYLRSADPAAAPAHQVIAGAAGWLDLGRPDARLWIGRGDDAAPPPGLRLHAGPDGTAVVDEVGAPRAPGIVVVWQLDTARPAWAAE
jgi:redox-sensitive bicupin YhaK (pirin superfamily)